MKPYHTPTKEEAKWKNTLTWSSVCAANGWGALSSRAALHQCFHEVRYTADLNVDPYIPPWYLPMCVHERRRHWRLLYYNWNRDEDTLKALRVTLSSFLANFLFVFAVSTARPSPHITTWTQVFHDSCHLTFLKPFCFFPGRVWLRQPFLGALESGASYVPLFSAKTGILLPACDASLWSSLPWLDEENRIPDKDLSAYCSGWTGRPHVTDRTLYICDGCQNIKLFNTY